LILHGVRVSLFHDSRIAGEGDFREINLVALWGMSVS